MSIEQLSEQQWEYCQLILYGLIEREVKEQGRKGKREFYSLAIRYFGPQGKYQRFDLSKRGDEAQSGNPWHKAFGILGMAGWELVSVQHGGTLHEEGDFIGTRPYLIVATAYFKRPVRQGRRIDEPEMIL